jgi:transposase-like protein
MSKRGSRFTQEERLTILEDGERNGVKAVCAKYDISDQSYQLWRYKANRIKPQKQRSPKEKLRISRGIGSALNRPGTLCTLPDAF